jgi:hypothetical protein
LQGSYREFAIFQIDSCLAGCLESAEIRHFLGRIPCARNREFRAVEQGASWVHSGKRHKRISDDGGGRHCE